MLFEIAPRHQRNIDSVDIQSELIELRQSYEVLYQKLNKIFNWIPTSPIQSHRSRQAKFCKEYDSNDYHSTSSSTASETTIVSPSSMHSFVSNIFIDGKECSKENSIVDWNFPPIFDNYLVKNCELCNSKVVEDDDETFFVQIQKIIDFTEENYLEVRFIPLAIEELGVKTLFLKERNPHVDFFEIDKYLFFDDKLVGKTYVCITYKT